MKKIFGQSSKRHGWDRNTLFYLKRGVSLYNATVSAPQGVKHFSTHLSSFDSFFFFVSLTPMINKLVLNKKCERVDTAALVDKGSRQTVGSKE